MNIFFVSLGCDKNLVDSEMMITSLRKSGYTIVDDETTADVIVVNTCCFIGDAKEESINTLLEMAEYKNDRCRLLVAAGCLAQRYHDDIKKDIPEVDVIIGTMAYEKLIPAIETALKEKNDKKDISAVECLEDINYLPEPLTERESTSGGYSAYLKIAEGCDKCCTYCVIPKVRGSYRSVPMDNLISQATFLAEHGTSELVLVAQETTLYGSDIYGKKSLHELLHKLSEINGVRWIRLLYCYPEEIYPELIEEIKNNEKVCHYIDMPIQHAADNVLKRMGRRTNKEELVNIIKNLREEIPDICIRTTLITGFPGESQEDFDELYSFVDSQNFDRLGVFTYSCEEDTPAAMMEDQIDEEVKALRRDKIMQLQQEKAFAAAEHKKGSIYEVMIEGRLPEDNVYIARTYMDAPDVDGYVFADYDGELISGEFVDVKITGANGYDLTARVI